MSKSHCVAQARRVNVTIIDHLKAGRNWQADYCRGFRNAWMNEARRAEK